MSPDLLRMPGFDAFNVDAQA